MPPHLIDRRRDALKLLCGGLACASAPSIATAVPSRPFGRFEGRIVAEWLDDQEDRQARRMRLTQPFSYVDGRGKAWRVPVGWVVDGASIPAPLWSWVGSPFTGGYRRASVPHDYYCDTKSEPWSAVHYMFYEACRAGGVGPSKAKLLYGAVYAFGPRWDRLVGKGFERRSEDVVSYNPPFSEERFRELKAYIGDADPSPADIVRHVDDRES